MPANLRPNPERKPSNNADVFGGVSGEGAGGATLRTLDWTDSNIPGRDEGELKPGAEAAPLGGFAA